MSQVSQFVPWEMIEMESLLITAVSTWLLSIRTVFSVVSQFVHKTVHKTEIKPFSITKNHCFMDSFNCCFTILPKKNSLFPLEMTSPDVSSTPSQAFVARVEHPAAARHPARHWPPDQARNPWQFDDTIWQCVKTLYPCSSHQNSWDLWMWITP